MKIQVLMTGSDGNCSLISYKNTNILIDAGFRTKTKMEEILNNILREIPIHAILITHEHTDHFNPWTGRLSIEWNIPIYLHKRHYETEENRKTKYLSYENKREGVTLYAGVNDIEENSIFQIRDLKIETFTVFHDARKTLGFIFNDGQLGWLTDCGFLSTNIKNKIKTCKNLAFEMNYDVNMLINSPRHWSNKIRILGKFGHLNIEEGLKFLRNNNFDTLITLHSSMEHSDLNKLNSDLSKLNTIKRFFVSGRENNPIIELED